MNKDEQIAKAYLETLMLGKLEFEPDGNVPPDFLLQSKIAIEVRRLNKNSFISGKPQGLEQTEIPLMKAAHEVLHEFDSRHDGLSYFVFVRFSRPLASKKEFKKSLRKELDAYLISKREKSNNIPLSKNVQIDIWPTPKDHGRPFLIGGNSDDERGGWVIEDMEINVQHCSDEKQNKIAPYKTKYPIWWLVLVDYIGYVLDDFERSVFKRDISIVHSWDKIIIVNPLNISKTFEI